MSNKRFASLLSRKSGNSKTDGAEGPKWSASELFLKAAQQKKELEREKEKQVLEETQSELQDTKSRYEQECQERENLQEQLDTLQHEYDVTCKELDKAGRLLEKTRGDVKKRTDQVDKLEREHYRMEGKIKHLEYRVAEVDRAEQEIDKLQVQLDRSQGECREKDSELRHAGREMEAIRKQLKESLERNKEMEEKMVDLKLQIREELMKNDHIQQLLDDVPGYEEQMKEKDIEIKQLKKDLDDKTILLQLARKNVRDTKDKVKAMDKKISQYDRVNRELHFAKCETTTLKSLMVGKDTVLIQKSQALDFAREVIETMESNNFDGPTSTRLEKIFDRLNLMATYPQKTKYEDVRPSSPHSEPMMFRVRTAFEDSSRVSSAPLPRTEAAHNHVPYDYSCDRSSEGYGSGILRNSGNIQCDGDNNNGHDNRGMQNDEVYDENSKGKFLRQILRSNSRSSLEEEYRKSERKKRPRPRTAVVRPNNHVDSFKNFRRKPSLVTDEVTIDLKSANQSGVTSPRSRPISARTDLSLAQTDNTDYDGPVRLKSLSGVERDQLMLNLVRVGNRIMVKLPVEEKRSRKKSKNIIKYQVFSGIVKFIGTVDKETPDHRLHAGIRMDSAIGDTDGAYKGKRYFYVPQAHGKLVRLSSIVSVLNVKESAYETVNCLLRDYLQKHTTGYSEGNQSAESHSSEINEFHIKQSSIADAKY